MVKNINIHNGFTNVLYAKFNDIFMNLSIAKEATTGKESNVGILIVGMIVVIVGLVGFILTKNKRWKIRLLSNSFF